jgi:glycosyltransferase involved in cell wall biosynthesis
MRVLLTSHQFFPQYAAGTEVLVYGVARELIRRGHEVRVLTGYPDTAALEDTDRFDEYVFEGIHVYRFHHAYTPMGGQESMIEIGYDNHLAAGYFERILAAFEPDVAHFFHLNRLGVGLIDCAARAGIARFMTPTDFWLVCPTAQLLLGDGSFCAGPSAHGGNCLKHFAQNTQAGMVGRIARWLPDVGADLLIQLTQQGLLPVYPKRAEVIAIAGRLPNNLARLNRLDGIIVPNKFMGDLLLRFGVPPEKVIEAAFGIDITPTPAVARSRIAGQALRIGFIGTLASYKGCHVVVDAFNRLPTAHATLQIYGREDEFPDYASKLRDNARNDPRIAFRGTFPNADIAQVFEALDVLVVPSLWYENTPLVVYSAQAAGCPIIASDLPGLSAVIEHDDNGLLFTAGESAELARQLLRLLEEDGLLRRLSANARPPKSTERYVDELLAIWPSSG